MRGVLEGSSFRKDLVFNGNFEKGKVVPSKAQLPPPEKRISLIPSHTHQLSSHLEPL